MKEKKNHFEEIMFFKVWKALYKQATNYSVLYRIEFSIIICSIASELFIFDKSDARSIV